MRARVAKSLLNGCSPRVSSEMLQRVAFEATSVADAEERFLSFRAFEPQMDGQCSSCNFGYVLKGDVCQASMVW